MTDNDITPTPPPQQTVGAKRIALGCGGCLALLLLIGFGVGVLISRTMRFAVGPEQVEVDDQSIFVYSLPGESRGIFEMDMLGIQVVQVASTDSPPTVLLTMGRLPPYIQDRQAQETLVESLQERMTVEGNYQVAEERVEERTLCGQPVAVVAQTGRFEQAQSTRDANSLLAFVEHNQRAQFVWILAQGEAPEASADQVFNSLECQ